MKWFVDFRDVENKRYDAKVEDGETEEKAKENFEKNNPQCRVIDIVEWEA